MERHSLLQALSLALIITTAIAASSCRTQAVVAPEIHTRDSVRSSQSTSQSNVYVHDSIYIREKGDTVYRDRWHTEIRDSIVNNTDTVRIVEHDSIPYPVEVPVEVKVEKPIAPFCKWSTIILWLGIAIVIGIRIKRVRAPV